MKIILKINSEKITNNFYSLVVSENNETMIINENNFGINVNQADLYKMIDDFFKKRTT